VVEHLAATRPAGLVGVWLHGSATADELRPDSDVDLLLVTTRSLQEGERRDLVDVLLQWSGRRATRGPGRPLEVVSVVRRDVVPWRYPPTCDLLYGEWLRDEVAVALPRAEPSPDLAVLLAAARGTAVPLVGPDLADVVPAVPPDDLRRAVLDALPDLLADLVGDERNVLLTLARMVVTLRTGLIVAKDLAAEDVASTTSGPTSEALGLAAAAYRGEADDEWGDVPVEQVAADLAALVRAGGLNPGDA
jgi:streptomycin 3"-adenylyltransferase